MNTLSNNENIKVPGCDAVYFLNASFNDAVNRYYYTGSVIN
jgi:hypothetical protein